MKFTWNGPEGAETIYPADATFENGATQAKPLFEGWLAPGKTTLDLPEDHPQAIVWKDRGWLTPPEDKPAEKTVKSGKSAPGAAEPNGAN